MAVWVRWSACVVAFALVIAVTVATMLAFICGDIVPCISRATGRHTKRHFALASLPEEDARRAVIEAEEETGLPADDPVRFGAGKLLDAVLKLTP